MKKTTAILFSAALLLCNCFTSKAQDVDGISLWDKCTKEQLIEKYGETIKYHSQMSDDNDYLIERFRFNDISISLEDSHVDWFCIESTRSRAMTKYVKGGIGIGDSVEILDNLEKFFFEKTLLDDGITTMYSYIFEYDNMCYIFVRNDVVVNISAQALTT